MYLFLGLQLATKMLKKLHLFILRSFAGPFFVTFIIAMFVLVMQFLWLWIDELVGKGLGAKVIGELLLYQSTTLVPLAIPISVLISCIMTFGNLGQHYEMVAMKASGIPLRKIMAPIFIFCVLLSILAFYIANIVVPDSVLKARLLLYDVQQKKPALNIREGIFYNGIENFSIKVGKKSDDGKEISDVMIYDHSSNKGNSALVVANRGKMEMSADSSYLFFTLYDGTRYEELPPSGPRNTLPFDRTAFKMQEMVLDLSGFKLSRTNEDLFKNNYQMLNINELEDEADSIGREIRNKDKGFAGSIRNFYHIYDTLNKGRLPDADILQKRHIPDNFTERERPQILMLAQNQARTVKGIAEFALAEKEVNEEYLSKIWMEWHRKFTLSIACMLFFFIGAPFGTIIRKGGLGMPMVSAVIIFVAYYMVMVSGEKFAKEGVMSPFMGTWLATLLMVPLGIFLTYKASVDSAIFSSEAYSRFFKKLIKRFARKTHEHSTAA